MSVVGNRLPTTLTSGPMPYYHTIGCFQIILRLMLRLPKWSDLPMSVVTEKLRYEGFHLSLDNVNESWVENIMYLKSPVFADWELGSVETN